jgi:hypothetical protein
VVLVGEAERRAAPRLAALVTAGEPEVERFVSWLASSCPPSAPPRVSLLGPLVAWCCKMEEAHSFWLHVLQVATLAVMGEFASGQSPGDLEKAAWWLSRAALTDEDLFLAAAALKHAGSSDAEAMLRAMLQNTPRDEELQRRMAGQLLFLNTGARMTSTSHLLHDPSGHSVWAYTGQTAPRDRVRRRAMGVAQ